MTIPSAHLQFALALLAHAHNEFHAALRLAKALNYTPNWVAAIEKAITDNQATHLHLGNTITCLGRRDESCLLALTEKENKPC